MQKLNDEREAIIKLIQDITDSKVRLERFYAQITSTRNELRPLYEQNKLDIDSIMTLSFHPELIDQKINELNGRLADINNQLDEKNPEGLKYKYVHTLQQLEEIKKKLSAPELEYQKYLKDKQDWENMIEKIIGTPEKDGTIKNLQARIDLSLIHI